MSNICTSRGNKQFSEHRQHTEGTNFSGRFVSHKYIYPLLLLILVGLANISTGQQLIFAKKYGNNITSASYLFLPQDCNAGNSSGSYFTEVFSVSALSFSFNADKMGSVASFRSGSSDLLNDRDLPEWPVLKEAILKLLSFISVSFFVFFVIPGVGALIISEHIH